MLNGPTGMGAAKLIADSKTGITANDYTVEVAAQPTDLIGKLSSGEVDIAALPTNVAANLTTAQLSNQVRCFGLGRYFHGIVVGGNPSLAVRDELGRAHAGGAVKPHQNGPRSRSSSGVGDGGLCPGGRRLRVGSGFFPPQPPRVFRARLKPGHPSLLCFHIRSRSFPSSRPCSARRSRAD